MHSHDSENRNPEVKVYEQKEHKGVPLWFWVGALMLLVGAGLYWANSPGAEVATTSHSDNLKPDSGAAMRAGGAWTVTSIADTFRSTGRFALTDAEVHFATGSSKLEGDSQAVLDQVATVLKDNGDWKMKVLGHTDSTGPAAANDKLAMERAEAVASYLNAHGVGAGRLTPVKQYGEHAAKADNASDTGRAENRRVELIKD